MAPTYLERGSRTFGGMAHLGRQAFFLARAFPAEFARARHILALPQYWGWRLSGVGASEVTSLAAQSHLWDVTANRPRSVVGTMGWRHLLRPCGRPTRSWARSRRPWPPPRGQLFGMLPRA